MKTVIRMYSGTIYHVEETIPEIESQINVMERADKGFLQLTGYVAPAGGRPRSSEPIRVKLKRIESMDPRS